MNTRTVLKSRFTLAVILALAMAAIALMVPEGDTYGCPVCGTGVSFFPVAEGAIEIDHPSRCGYISDDEYERLQAKVQELKEEVSTRAMNRCAELLSNGEPCTATEITAPHVSGESCVPPWGRPGLITVWVVGEYTCD